ncbi:NUDIX domain-containing protein [Candidatus Dojkabacteria bacterium]|uniref:NUDIX domain-containing protein n=1 Tax=Candidatus Dojkabacteria bacterium TaxID=2099670 RepID=A0A955L2W7_9BACT|nr:NUDIX domain-containing protein [Candidatus Dojkabacteria bacterium]
MKTTGIQIIFFNSKQEVLLLKRYSKSDWEFFSTNIIQSEGEYQAASRGSRLTLGLELNIEKLFSTRKYYQFTMNHDNRGDVNLLTFLYTLNLREKIELNQDDYSELVWVDKKNVVEFIKEKKLRQLLVDLQPIFRDYFELQEREKAKSK